MSRLTFRGRVLTDGKVVESAVVIEDGKIAAIGKNPGDAGGDVVDLKPNEVLIPAATDLGAHCRDWGQAYKETVDTATRAAIAGGITTVCDLTNTVPRVNTVENIQKRVALFEQKSYADFAVHAMQPLNPEEVERFKEAGAFAIHLFPWDLPDWNFPKDLDPLPGKIKQWMKLGLKGSVHLEEQSMRLTPLEVESERHALQAMLHRIDPEFHVRFRVSLAETVKRINDAKSKFPLMQVQTSPVYFCVSQEECWRRIGVAGSGAPLLADETNLAAVQDLLKQGAFDLIASDHHPHRIGDKYHEEPDAIKRWPADIWPKKGFTSLDYCYPLTIDRAGVAQGVRMFAENPAKVVGTKRGKIAKGYDADVVVLEEGDFLILPDEFESKGKVTPMAGEKISCRVKKTFMRGIEVFDAGNAAQLYSEGGPRTFNRIPIRKVA